MSDVPDYAADVEHDRMYLELTDVNGRIMASTWVVPPVNQNAAAPVQMQVRLIRGWCG